MIPLSIVCLVGIPFGIWAMSILNRREASPLVEEEKRLQVKQEFAAKSGLRDQESIWHDLGVIVGYFLRDNTIRILLGGAVMLLYVLCLIMFFSFHGGSSTVDGVTNNTFEAGQPSPWYVVKNGPKGHSSVLVLNSWSVLFAIVGVLSLLVGAEYGRAALWQSPLHDLALCRVVRVRHHGAGPRQPDAWRRFLAPNPLRLPS